jgi:hypothetical protein
LPWSSLFIVWKTQKSHGARSGLYGRYNGVPTISVSSSIENFQSRNTDAPLNLLRHPKMGSFETTLTPTRSNKVSPRTFQTTLVFIHIHT